MAKYLSLSGEPEAALPLAEQACRAAEASGTAVEVTLRRWDKASLLLQAGRPSEALAIAEERTQMEDELLGDRIDVSLLRAEAYQGVGNLSEAHDWLQRALADIDTYHIEYKRPRAEMIAKQLCIAFECDPEEVEAWAGTGMLHFVSGNSYFVNHASFGLPYRPSRGPSRYFAAGCSNIGFGPICAGPTGGGRGRDAGP